MRSPNQLSRYESPAIEINRQPLNVTDTWHISMALINHNGGVGGKYEWCYVGWDHGTRKDSLDQDSAIRYTANSQWLR